MVHEPLPHACCDGGVPGGKATDTLDFEGALLLAFRHSRTCTYLARFIPMIVAEGKFNVLASSEYIAGDTCYRKKSEQI
jgi:hypothetical protein